MVSAFHAPNKMKWDFQEESFETREWLDTTASTLPDRSFKSSWTALSSGVEAEASETEDEEVKISCIGGVRVYETSSDDDDDDDEEGSCYSEESSGDENERGIVSFAERPLYRTPEIFRPRPYLGGIMECDDHSDISSSGSDIRDDDGEEAHDQASCLSDDESTDTDEESSGFCDDNGDDCGGDDAERDCDTIASESCDHAESDDDDDDDDDDNSAASSKVSLKVFTDEQHLDAPTLFDLCSTCQGNPEICQEGETLGDTFLDLDNHELQTKHQLEKLSMTVPPLSAKRIIASISADDDQHYFSNYDTPKRMRCSISRQSISPGMTSFYLGPSAYGSLDELRYKDDPAVSPFSEQEAEYDRALGEELAEAAAAQAQSSSSENGDSIISDRAVSPVPLLSPPPSPLCIESEQGQRSTMCEWPCNLAVDYALLLAGLRSSHSPVSSLVMMEEEQLKSWHHPCVADTGTSLTPLLRGIRVNLE